ncbi:MAG: rod shape-determining protein MreD [Gammaproteobacteria bacterium]|nr:rod shape-determining protein MreD [Gammaproteobacteria bacterium]
MGRGIDFGQIFALIAVLALAVVPLPDSIAPYRPAWAAVVLIYWSLASPRRAGFIATFLTGLALDALSGTLIGQHALALLIVVYVTRKLYLRLRAFPVSQLALFVAMLLAVYQFVLFWMDGVAGRAVSGLETWAPVLGGTLLWIAMWSLLDRGRREAPARL